MQNGLFLVGRDVLTRQNLEAAKNFPPLGLALHRRVSRSDSRVNCLPVSHLQKMSGILDIPCPKFQMIASPVFRARSLRSSLRDAVIRLLNLRASR